VNGSIFDEELAPESALAQLLDKACNEIHARFPRTVQHAGRTWWLNVRPGGDAAKGLAVIALFDKPDSTRPVHVVIATLGSEFGHRCAVQASQGEGVH
jgi:hypothetical protein